MADSGSSTSPAENYKKTTSSFFNSPRLFTNFTPKGFNETETMMSPTSILDSKPFTGFKSPFFGSETNSPKTPVGEHKRYWDKLESKAVGLGLVDALVDEKQSEVNSKHENRTVLFGSKLKIQIPHLGSSTGSLSLSPVGKKSASGCANSSLGVFTGCLSANEMELSEDYTRVISHGPNPRTTHIFDNCIIETTCFDVGCSVSAKETGYFPPPTSYPSESFLSICFYCKKNLEHGKDIYMYRGERAFCSHECRYQGMLLEAEDV